MLFHAFVDDFMPKYHDFSQKIEKFSKILAPAKPKFGIFIVKKLGFFSKVTPLDQLPPIAPWFI